MLHACYLKKIARTVTLYVIKVAKCKRLPYKILNHYTYCQKATEEEESSGNWPMIQLWKTLKEYKRYMRF
jgi:hypothetical protein